MSTTSNYPWWAPRFWHGMRIRSWWRLLHQNGFRVAPRRWGLACTVTGLTCFNSCMSRWSHWRYGKQLAELPLVDDPIFIVGHWRSGTTYLHELLSLDERFATPTTYQCFAASHFLVTEQWLPHLIWFVMPAQRPMDNVRTAWTAPQEDEFALCTLGCGSPYLRIAFPNSSRDYLDYLDFHHLSEDEIKAWHEQLRHFLRSLTLSTGKRLVLKSPTHTARIGVLAQFFPRARFLHIVRDPRSVFPSTMKLWRVLDDAQGLQIPRHDRLKEYVLTAFERTYAAFEVQRTRLSASQIVDIRYEDLVEDPVSVLTRAYAALQLGDLPAVAPRLAAYVATTRSYRTNQYDLDAATESEVLDRWASYARRYGYV